MSHEHEQTSLKASAIADGIHSEPAPFEPGYQPENLPKLTVPDLPADAQGLSAEALLNVPTLTELVDTHTSTAPVASVPEVGHAPEDPVVSVPEVAIHPDVVSEDASASKPEPFAQAEPAHADTQTEQFQLRMGKLTGDIHSLNARLDRLEERHKKKV